jgi:hypothetical protein
MEHSSPVEILERFEHWGANQCMQLVLEDGERVNVEPIPDNPLLSPGAIAKIFL